jgi:inhibitor of cysteine peptidase
MVKIMRMKKIILILLILLFSASYCFGQGSMPAEMIDAQAGHSFTITLPANPTTGYQWQLARPLNDKMVKLIKSEYVADDTSLIGSGGNQVWKFKALAEGRAAVALKYVKPSEKNATPEVKYFIVVIRK